jgi:excisionase family DNA binding protein
MATTTPRPDLGVMFEPEAVADALQVGRGTVYRLIRSGELKAKKIGRQYRIPEASLNEYLGITSEPGQLPEPAAA